MWAPHERFTLFCPITINWKLNIFSIRKNFPFKKESLVQITIIRKLWKSKNHFLERLEIWRCFRGLTLTNTVQGDSANLLLFNYEKNTSAFLFPTKSILYESFTILLELKFGSIWFPSRCLGFVYGLSKMNHYTSVD